MSSIVVAETLIERNVGGVDIKWPNDVMVNDLKLCGILVESVGTGAVSAGVGGPRIIVGIGVNLNHEFFPDELRSTATSLKIETGQATVVEEFRDQLLSKLADWYARWKSGECRLILDRWQQLSGYARGLQVTIALDGEVVSGETSGLTDDGALMLRLPDGSLRTILSGDVTRLRKSQNA